MNGSLLPTTQEKLFNIEAPQGLCNLAFFFLSVLM